MRLYFNYVKKIGILLISATLVNLSVLPPLQGQGIGLAVIDAAAISVLKQILDKINNLTDVDTSDPSATMQANFTTLGKLLPTDLATQLSLQTTLNNDLLGNNGDNAKSFNAGGQAASAPTASTIAYGNDLVYSTLLDAPLFGKDPRQNVDASLNYILNASGSNIYHEMPTGSFRGKQASVRRYQGFYNTIMAATSFNNYILSKSYADKNQFNTLQTTLIQQASDPAKWFVEVGKEEISFVLRQQLMYTSQIFVLLTEMVQLQKQLATAQAMNTATLIAVNQINENTLTSYAKGQQPAM